MGQHATIHLESCVNEGCITVSKVIVGRQKKLIAITDKGRGVAENFRKHRISQGETQGYALTANTEYDMDAVYSNHCFGARLE